MSYIAVDETFSEDDTATLLSAPGSQKAYKIDSITLVASAPCFVRIKGGSTNITGRMWSATGGGLAHSLPLGGGVTLPPNTALVLDVTGVTGSTVVGGLITYSKVG